MNFVSDTRLIELPRHAREDGEVVVAESMVHVPFSIARLFILRAPVSAERGKHAHKLCSQFFLCASGAADVICDDGREQRMFTLDRGNLALLVPPTIWNTVVFHKPETVVVVLCDRLYEAHDYLRDYNEFLQFRKDSQS